MRTGNTGQPPFWRAMRRARGGAAQDERRVRGRVLLKRLTAEDGQWLAELLPALQGRARPEPDAVRVEDVVLRHRPGRIGIADALDATAEILEPFAAAGATLEHRSEWYINDEEEEDDDSENTARRLLLDEEHEEPDLVVSLRVIVDAAADDAGAAALYWAALALAN
jgi:hypothetical protein